MIQADRLNKLIFHLPGRSYVPSSSEDVSRFGDGSRGRDTSGSGVGREFLEFTTVALNRVITGFVALADLTGTVGTVLPSASS